MMRDFRTFSVIVAAVFATGCAGTYDRELLGDPVPIPVSRAPATGVGAVVPDSYDVESDVPGDDIAPSRVPTDYEMFDELDAYGGWYPTVDFGMVWRPTVVSGWRPFHHGHWIWTSYGWMWASYEPFGWATYHYGSWWLDPMLGWIWVPGYEWSACPVTWFYTDYYIGWAPLPPPGRYWDDPWNDGGRYRDGWTVVEAGKFKEVDVGQTRVTPTRFKADYRTGSEVRRAPDTRVVEKATRQSVNEANVRIDSRRVGGREVRKVVLPSHERQIVDRFPMVVPSNPMPIQTVAPVQGGETSGGEAKKSRGSSTPATKGTPPAKVKDARDSKGSSKSPPKAKGESDPDDATDGGKSTGDSNRGNSKDDKSDGSGKAKGGKR